MKLFFKEIRYEEGHWVKYSNKIFPRWIPSQYLIYLGKDNRNVKCYTTTKSYNEAIILQLLLNNGSANKGAY